MSETLTLRFVPLCVVVILTVASSLRGGGPPCDPAWDTAIGQLGVDGVGSPGINVLGVFDLGSGPKLYAGGRFEQAGGVNANSIAVWNGSSWTALGSGVENESTSEIYPKVFALAQFDDGTGAALYVGGSFKKAGGVVVNNIAKWDGSSWSALGSGTNSFVAALAVFDSGSGQDLYAGGLFIEAGGRDVDHIAKWNGIRWSPLERGPNRSVNALTVFEDANGPALYVGGLFTQSTTGIQLAHIARWSSAGWESVGRGIGGDVFALGATSDASGVGPALYAGGNFNTASGVSAANIAMWDGTRWSALGGGTNAPVIALSVFDDASGRDLYAGGIFTQENAPGGATLSHIGKWDGSAWSPLSTGTDAEVQALAHGGRSTPDGAWLYVGGTFQNAGGRSASRVARWGSSCGVADCNGNGDVDLDDYAVFWRCTAGPVGGVASGCECVDLNADGTVDLADFRPFQQLFTGQR